MSKARINFVIETDLQLVDKLMVVPMDLLLAHFSTHYGIDERTARRILIDFEELQQQFVDNLSQEKFLAFCEQMIDSAVAQCELESGDFVISVGVRNYFGIQYAI